MLVCTILQIGDELIADDDNKQQLLNCMIQVCQPKDWQISLLEDRLTKRQLAISSSYSQKRLGNVLKGWLQLIMHICIIYNIHKWMYIDIKIWSTVPTSNTGVQADYLAIAPG